MLGYAIIALICITLSFVALALRWHKGHAGGHLERVSLGYTAIVGSDGATLIEPHHIARLRDMSWCPCAFCQDILRGVRRG
jgi:hypothetical protein